MSFLTLALIAFQSLLIFIVGLIIGFHIGGKNDANGESECFRESIKLWKEAVDKIDDLTRRTVVQLGSFRERITNLNQSIDARNLEDPLDDMMEQISLIEKEIKDLKSCSESILDIDTRHHSADLPQVQSKASSLDSYNQHSNTEGSSFEKLVAKVRKKVELETPLSDLLDLVYDELPKFVPCQRMGYAEIDYNIDLVTAVWCRSDRPCRLKGGYSARLSESSLRFLAKLQKPRVLNNLPDYLRRHPKSDSTRLIIEEGYRSSLTLPIVARGSVVAFLFISNTDIDSFGSDAVVLAKKVVAQISQSVHLPKTSRTVEPALR